MLFCATQHFTVMTARQKPATSLVLRLEHLPQGIQAVLLSNRLFKDPSNYNPEHDSDMLFAVDWMCTRAPTPEVNFAKSQMPAHSDIRYLRPGAPENPLLLSTCNSNGDELTIDAPWLLLMEAVSWKDMGLLIKSFFEDYMGIGKPLKDGTFCWNGNHKSKFVTRKNRNPHNGRTWNSNFAIQVQVVGTLHLEVMNFLMNLFGGFPFLVWNGQFAYDSSHGEFAKTFACECADINHVQMKVDQLQKIRLEKYDVVEDSETREHQKTQNQQVPHSSAAQQLEQHQNEPRDEGKLAAAAQWARGRQEAPGEGQHSAAAQQLERMQDEPREEGAREVLNDCDARRDGYETPGKVQAREQAAERDKSMDKKLDEMLNQGLVQNPQQEARGAADGEGLAQPCTPTELLQQVAKRGAATDATPEPRPRKLSEALSPLLEARASRKIIKVDNGIFKKCSGINDFEKVENTQIDDDSEVEEVTTSCKSKVDLTSRLEAMEKQNAQILQFLQSCVLGSSSGRAALPSSGSDKEYTISIAERT